MASIFGIWGISIGEYNQQCIELGQNFRNFRNLAESRPDFDASKVITVP